MALMVKYLVNAISVYMRTCMCPVRACVCVCGKLVNWIVCQNVLCFRIEFL